MADLQTERYRGNSGSDNGDSMPILQPINDFGTFTTDCIIALDHWYFKVNKRPLVKWQNHPHSVKIWPRTPAAQSDQIFIWCPRSHLHDKFALCTTVHQFVSEIAQWLQKWSPDQQSC